MLKFDMKLVRGIDIAPKSKRQMVESLVHMTRDLGITPLAEGVETEEEATVCQQLGFELFQGFLFGSPIPRKTSGPAKSSIPFVTVSVKC